MRQISLPGRVRVLLAGIALFAGPGIIANPFVVMPSTMHDPVGDGILVVEGLLGIAWWLFVCGRYGGWRKPEALDDQWPTQQTLDVPCPTPPITIVGPARPCLTTTLLAGCVLVPLWLAMHWNRVTEPRLFVDDFHYVDVARSFTRTWSNLLTPFNEHVCVLTRLFTWLGCCLSGDSDPARVLAYGGMALFSVCAIVFFVYLVRETGNAILAWAGTGLFLFSAAHREIVNWYSASQWSWALLLMLGNLVLLQRSGIRSSGRRLVATAALSAVACFNFAVGAFVGPISAIYLLLKSPGESPPLARWSRCGVPVVGTVVALAVLIPLKAPQVLAAASYGGRAAADAIAPFRGVLYGVRSVVDLLFLKNLGIDVVGPSPRVVYVIGFALAVFAGGELVRLSRRPAVPALGGSIILFADAVTLPFRAWVQYESYVQWTRYQLFPQLGVALLAVTAMDLFVPREWREPRTKGQMLCVLLAVPVLLRGLDALL